MVTRTIHTTPRALAELSVAEKRALLVRLLEEKSAATAGSFPLSHGQRGLWFLHQMDPHSPAYNICHASRFRSKLNLPAFRRALQKMIDRHPSLRTVFEDRDGILLQRVSEPTSLPLEIIDASPWSEAELRMRLETESDLPFDLTRGPLVRMHLFRRASDDHIFLLSAHHIVGDFWSLVLLIAELQALYPAECDGRRITLPPPARHYSDFVHWQAELLGGPEGERLLSYWQRQLANAPRTLDLPTDRPRPAVFSRRGGAVTWRLEADLVRGLKTLAAKEATTLYAVTSRRVPGPALSVYGSGGFPGRLPLRRPQPVGVRGRGRLFHQHAPSSRQYRR